MAVGKMLFRRNLLGYKHIQRPGSIEQNTDTGKALQKFSWDCEDLHGFKILSLSDGIMKFLHKF